MTPWTGGAGSSLSAPPARKQRLRGCGLALCNAGIGIAQSMDVSTVGSKRATTSSSEFGVVYRECFGLVTAYFARRCTEPQVVADLVSETFVEAVASFGTFDPSRGSARGWLIAIARRVFARWCEERSGDRVALERLGGRLVLDADQTDELSERIDAERRGRELLASCALLPALEREAIELVDLTGLEPKDAARVLGVPAGTLRVRLHRARARLRKGTA
jgi:RNA polymerase sigma factor (sigma-70 family)